MFKSPSLSPIQPDLEESMVGGYKHLGDIQLNTFEDIRAHFFIHTPMTIFSSLKIKFEPLKFGCPVKSYVGLSLYTYSFSVLLRT